MGPDDKGGVEYFPSGLLIFHLLVLVQLMFI